jgi:hypothetical protein
VVVGEKPAAAPGLSDHPRCDNEVRRIANEVWGDCDGKRVFEHKFGKGKVVWGRPLDALLPELGAPPDLEYPQTANLDYIHRRDGEADIYFVSSQSEQAATIECTFRVNGKQPEVWDPATGLTTKPAIYRERDGRTALPLRFDPAGSIFVVFREKRKTEPVAGVEPSADVRITAAGSLELIATRTESYVIRWANGRSVTPKVRHIGEPLVMQGPWEVRFPKGWGAPEIITLDRLISWTDHPHDGVRHFSGSAVYRKQIEIPAAMVQPDRIISLDLGKVKETARVRLNGHDLGWLWKPAFAVDITAAARAGVNTLEITVANLWPNRLIGDSKLPEEKRYTWTNSNMYKADSPLLESGLLGPVVIHPAAIVPV